MLFLTNCLHECYIITHMTMHFEDEKVMNMSNMLQLNTKLRSKKQLHDYINLIEYDRINNMAEKRLPTGLQSMDTTVQGLCMNVTCR